MHLVNGFAFCDCMPRKNLILSDVHPYHIVARSNNKEIFYVPLEVLWPIFVEKLEVLKIEFSCVIHAFVLMGNHYHLIISTPLANINKAIEYLNREVSRAANKKAARINHFFGGRYKWSIITNEIYYWNALKYVYRNPVKANICTAVGTYKYSSLNDELGKSIWHLTKGSFGFDELAWFESDFGKDLELSVQKALRRREFKLPRNKDGFVINLDAPLRKKGGGT